MNNGALRNLSADRTQSLFDHTDGRLKGRKVYLKLAILAVLKYDGAGYPLSASQIRTIGQKYLPRNSGFSNQVVGSILGMLSRMKLINRSYDRPHTYWWRDKSEI